VNFPTHGSPKSIAIEFGQNWWVQQHEHDGQTHGDELHLSHRGGWLRAAVLGANDGLLSTASLLTGVAAGNVDRSALVLTGIAAIGAGALSMASGEYVSVASQRDSEHADIAMERAALEAHPKAELNELRVHYENRGLPPALAREVAEHFHATDPLDAHTRDELGLDPHALARPLQAAVTSACSFALGAMPPVLAALFLSRSIRLPGIFGFTLLALVLLGYTAARLGGGSRRQSILRMVVLGAGTMGATIIIGRLVGGVV
jgi:vacuolar iron transporter family protein